MRTITPLIENWKFVKNAENAALASAMEGELVSLPHTWNAKDGQDGGNDYHRGTCYYVTRLAKPSRQMNKYILNFWGQQ